MDLKLAVYALSGAVAALFLRWVVGGVSRWWLRHKLVLENPVLQDHKVHVAVRNCGDRTLERARAQISIPEIKRNPSVIVQAPAGMHAFIQPSSPIPLEEDYLCWSTHIPNPNPAETDIFPGEKQNLEILQLDPNGHWIIIFSEKRHDPARVFLEATKSYEGYIKIVSATIKAKKFQISIDARRKDQPLQILTMGWLRRVVEVLTSFLPWRGR